MNPASESELWVICPVCSQPNPDGTQFCKHCWGAIIQSDSPLLPYHEIKRKIARRLLRQRLQKVIKLITISLASLLIIFLGLSSLTDVIFKPPQGVNSNSIPGEWAMFRHDLDHSGTSSLASSLPQGIVKWVFPTAGAIHSSPAVAEDTVYFGSRNGKVYALDSVTGAKRWEFKTGSWVESSPAIANGVVYIGSNDGKLYALDADSGQKLWDFNTRYPIMSTPAVANGIVYLGAGDSYFYALDAVKGTRLWAFESVSPIMSSPTVADGIVYFGSGDNLYALWSTDGRFRLAFKSSAPVISSPVVSQGTVYFNDSKGFLFAVDGNARNYPREHALKPYWIQLWIMFPPFVPTPPPQSGFLWSLRLGTSGASSPAIAGDTIYISSDNKLFALDLPSRQKRWEFKTEGTITSSPAVVGSTIYVGSEDRRLYAVNAATGDKLWDIFIGDKLTSSPAVADGTIYFGSDNGNLYAIK